jgi:hypothetical protein
VLGPELEATDATATTTVDFPQLGLQMQAPDLRVIGQFIAVQGQAFNDGIEYRLSDKWAMKRALSLDG